MQRRFVLAVLFALCACHSAAPFVADRLFFGRNIPTGGTVSESQWVAFVRDVVTPRFPNGLTIFAAKGEWRGGAEDVYVVEIVHVPTPPDEEKIAQIAGEYKKRFAQETVLRVTSGARMRLY